MEDAVDFFVYGTLKRGECRERCWPRKPVKILEACVRGCLYDLGAYPAMIPGDDWVLGEVWSIGAGDVEETLRVLDEIEDYEAGGENNLYNRVSIDWFPVGDPWQPPLGSQVGGTALTYHFAGPQRLHRDRLMKASAQGTVYWAAGGGT